MKKIVAKALTCSALLGTLMTAGVADAKLAGKNVILVHGFQPNTVEGRSLSVSEIDRNGRNYWSNYWTSRAEGYVNWDSNERVETGIADDVKRQVISLARNGTCNSGCVFVTHSTGDLVTRMILDRQAAWLRASRLAPLNIVATLDFAGAGGGTEIADFAYDVSTGSGFGNMLGRQAVRIFLGGTDPEPGNLGVMNDLRVSKARSIATASQSIPRLRFAGGGSEFFGVTGGFITGTDDGVVPLHSACGASRAQAIDSCSRNITISGDLKRANGPSGLWSRHYPVIMSNGIHHNGMVRDQKNQRMVPVMNDFTAGGLRIDLNDVTRRGWFGGSYRYIDGANRKTMSQVVYETLNS